MNDFAEIVHSAPLPTPAGPSPVPLRLLEVVTLYPTDDILRGIQENHGRAVIELLISAIERPVPRLEVRSRDLGVMPTAGTNGGPSNTLRRLDADVPQWREILRGQA